MIRQKSQIHDGVWLLHYGKLTVYVGHYHDSDLLYVGYDSDLRYCFNTERGFRNIDNAVKYVNKIMKRVLKEALAETETDTTL